MLRQEFVEFIETIVLSFSTLSSAQHRSLRFGPGRMKRGSTSIRRAGCAIAVDGLYFLGSTGCATVDLA